MSVVIDIVFAAFLFSPTTVPFFFRSLVCVVKMNRAIQNFNDNSNSRRKINLFTMSEFYRANAMFIGAVCFTANGSALFKGDDNNVQDNWITIEPNAYFNRWMAEYRFKEFRQFIPTIYEDVSRKQNDPWWRFSSGVDQFNLNRLKYIVPSNHMTMDELMSA